LIFAGVLGKAHPRVQQSAQWISQFTAGALEMVKTGKSTIAPKISQIAPLTWVSLRSAAPYKGRLSMNDLLQLVEVKLVFCFFILPIMLTYILSEVRVSCKCRPQMVQPW
jgi:hypothetical protein